jgi:hypothetical protein
MKIQIENIIEPNELRAINTIISMVSNGDLIQTYNFITTARSQEYRLEKANIKTGMGSNHIWVSNWRGQRILLITE